MNLTIETYKHHEPGMTNEQTQLCMYRLVSHVEANTAIS